MEDDEDDHNSGADDCGDQEKFEEQQRDNNYPKNAWVIWLIQDGSESYLLLDTVSFCAAGDSACSMFCWKVLIYIYILEQTLPLHILMLFFTFSGSICVFVFGVTTPN